MTIRLALCALINKMGLPNYPNLVTAAIRINIDPSVQIVNAEAPRSKSKSGIALIRPGSSGPQYRERMIERAWSREFPRTLDQEFWLASLLMVAAVVAEAPSVPGIDPLPLSSVHLPLPALSGIAPIRCLRAAPGW